jgi:two-component system, chemotaxis family, CheB/CheR fusion protein
VLSGSGHDGTLGLKAIKEHGGLTIAQGANVTRPRFAEMPLSAVAAGIVDLELPVDLIPERIISYVRNWGVFDAEPKANAMNTIYVLLRTRTEHDFSEYKDRTFQRQSSAACRSFRPQNSRTTPSGYKTSRMKSTPYFVTL